MFRAREQSLKKEADKHYAQAKNGEGDWHYGKAKKYYKAAEENREKAEKHQGKSWNK